MSDNTKLLKCPACGAPIHVPEGKSITTCPYCHNSVMIPGASETPQATRPPMERSSSPQPSTWETSLRPNMQTSTRKGKGGIIVFVSLAILAAGIAAAILFAGKGDLAVQPFASQLLSFGAEGTGPGLLNDPRTIGINRDGNIYVGDFNDGRINIFDSTGKFLRLISLGDKAPIESLAVSPDGTLYLLYGGKIHRQDSQGNDTVLDYDDSGNTSVFLDNFVLGADGSLVAADSTGDVILRFGPDGKVNLVIRQVFESVTGEREMAMLLAVDGLGTIFVLGRDSSLVLKYSPEGKYVDQFGGPIPASTVGITQGRFQSPSAIAVDGYGRVYISDSEGTQVLDSNGQYLDSLNLSCTPRNMVFDLNNDLYLVSNTTKVIKLSVKKP